MTLNFDRSIEDKLLIVMYGGMNMPYLQEKLNQKSHVNKLTSHVEIVFLHVNKIMLHVKMISLSLYVGCRDMPP